METCTNEKGSRIVYDMIKVIQRNKQYLSELDGSIGDGDHGINMNKGFTATEEELKKNPGDLAHGLKTLSRMLMNIGGAMGPLYGIFFRSMAKTCNGKEVIDADTFLEMLEAGEAGVKRIGNANVGDKTLLDALAPAVDEFKSQVENGRTFKQGLDAMRSAAVKGRNSTKDMVAKVGRSSRMGERSRGILDPGATSMCLLLVSMAESVRDLLDSAR